MVVQDSFLTNFSKLCSTKSQHTRFTSRIFEMEARYGFLFLPYQGFIIPRYICLLFHINHS